MPEHTQTNPEPHKHYDSAAYQRIVSMEKRALHGLPPLEVYRREASFALRAAGYDKPDAFREGEAIFDCASGAADHAFLMNDMLGGCVPILASDPSVNLGQLACEKYVDREGQGVRQQIDFLFDPERAKMQNLQKEDVDRATGGKRIRLLTNLGSSFGYTNVRESRQTLRNIWNILEPGGTAVFQWRQRPLDRQTDDYKVRKERAERAGVDLGVRWDDTAELDGKRIGCYREVGGERAGECYFGFGVDCDHPDPDCAEEYEKITGEAGALQGMIRWRHRETGIDYESIERVLIGNDGVRTNLPKNRMSYCCWEDKETGVAKMEKLLREAGFVDIQFHQPVSEEDWVGAHRLLAMTAKKP